MNAVPVLRRCLAAAGLGFALAAGAAPPLPASLPVIERFATIPVARLEPGRELRYLVNGTPGGEASLAIPGVAEAIAMRETGPGYYEASYRVRPGDDLHAFAAAVITLRLAGEAATYRSSRAFPRDRERPATAAAF